MSFRLSNVPLDFFEFLSTEFTACLKQSCKRADQFRLEPGPKILAQTRPESETISPNTKTNLKPKSCPKVKSSLKTLAMLPSFFDYIFVHLT